MNAKNKPFTIAIYFGTKDPDSDGYLLDFVNELIQLQENGFEFCGSTYPFAVRNFILDAPARSLVKCCIGHGGYGACEKCTVFGESVDDRTVYHELNFPLRTDESFRNKEDPVHHIGTSLLEAAGIGMVSQFRLDTFHLVWHGVFKRLITVWDTWPGVWRWNTAKRDQMTEILEGIASFCPCDFNRYPKSIRDYHFFKGTEERRMLLYDGILVFRDVQPQNVYNHYLLLHVGMYILCSPVYVKTMVDFAENCLKSFVEHSARIYGRKFIVYNVHSLIHLGQECRVHGAADSFSAFDFENALKSIKETLRTGRCPLQQVAYRDYERSKNISVIPQSLPRTVSVSWPVRGTANEFERLTIDGIEFKCNKRDSCFMTADKEIVILKKIVKRHNIITLVGHKFLKRGDFYTYPLPSSRLNIFQVSDVSRALTEFELHCVRAKCWLLRDVARRAYVCLPLLHTYPLF